MKHIIFAALLLAACGHYDESESGKSPEEKKADQRRQNEIKENLGSGEANSVRKTNEDPSTPDLSQCLAYPPEFGDTDSDGDEIPTIYDCNPTPEDRAEAAQKKEKHHDT